MITLSYASAALTTTVVLFIAALLCLAFFGWGYQGGRRAERGALGHARARQAANVATTIRRALPPAGGTTPAPRPLPYAARDRFGRPVMLRLVRIGRRHAGN